MRVFSVGGTDSSPEEEEEEKEVAGGFAHHSDRRDASRDARASTALRLGRRLHPEQRRGLLVDPHRGASCSAGDAEWLRREKGVSRAEP